MAASLGHFSGVVLAGGHSQRMGTEKALLEIGGTPLWRRQLDLISQFGASEKWVSMRTEQTWLPLGISRLNDAVADSGPMAGISLALTKSRYEHLAVIAVDLPNMTTAWYRRIGQRCADGIGVVGQHADGTYEPLAAIYPKKVSARMAASLTERALSLQAFVKNAIEDGYMRAEEIRPEDKALFENWNEPR